MDVVDGLLQTLDWGSQTSLQQYSRETCGRSEALWVAEMSFLLAPLAHPRIEWEGRQQKTRNCSRKVARALKIVTTEQLHWRCTM